MTRLLIVDDELKIREVVKEYSLMNGYEVDEASDGLEAIDKVKNNDYDCIILDVMMLNLDGFSACKQIKSLKKIPIIMLSARNEEYDKLFGFELGVDDYVVKPFSCKEIDLLFYMVKNRNIALSRERLLEEVWDIDYFGEDRTVDTHIKMLRHNLGPYRDFIVTVRGMGYKFEA